MALKKFFLIFVTSITLIYFVDIFNYRHQYQSYSKVIDKFKIDISIERKTFFKSNFHVLISLHSTQNPELFTYDFKSFIKECTLLTDQNNSIFSYDSIKIITNDDYTKKCKIIISDIDLNNSTQLIFYFFHFDEHQFIWKL